MALTLEREITYAKINHPKFGEVFYATPNKQCEVRVGSLFTKEPDTIEWIAEMDPGDVFVDIGANVGMYAVWAAKTAGARVFAFEPEGQNFAVLCQNILINHLDAMAFPFAIGAISEIAPLYVSQFFAAGSCHTFGERVNWKGKEMRPAFVQGSICMPLDQTPIPPPDYIKIDVDGLEPAVLRGAKRCLEHARSVLIEVDTNRAEHRAMIGYMEDLGFRYDPAQAERSRRKEDSKFVGIGNVIFRR